LRGERAHLPEFSAGCPPSFHPEYPLGFFRKIEKRGGRIYAGESARTTAHLPENSDRRDPVFFRKIKKGGGRICAGHGAFGCISPRIGRKRFEIFALGGE